MLAPAEGRDNTYFQAHFGNSAVVGEVELDTAVAVAGDVARGELSSGQLYGFFMKFGSSDESPKSVLDLGEAAGIIKAVNRGDIDATKLDTVMNPDTFFGDKLANKVWKRMFSGQLSHGGNKYTVSGMAPMSLVTGPFMKRMSDEVVSQLTSDDAKLKSFAEAFPARLEEALPSSRAVKKRSDDNTRWEVDVYAGAMESAFRSALRDADID
jgi:hypothetical protein